jgi:hypothetical protein
MRGSIKYGFLFVAVVIVLMALANTVFEHDVHAWRYAGECLDCHSRQGDVELKPGWTITPPESHNAQFRRYTHGKGDGLSYRRCASCHRQEECRDCHNILPESHTNDFVNPRGIGMERHIMLATIRPATCLICHESFVSQCVTCHTPAEVKPWEEQAHREMSDWEMAR